MPRPTSLVFLALLVAGLALVVAWVSLRDDDGDGRRFPVGTFVHELSMREIELRGRLLDASTGRPLTDVGVLALLFESEAQDAKVLSSFAWRTAAVRGARAGGPAPDEESMEAIYSDPESHTLTDAEGRFRVSFRDTDCRAYLDGKPTDPSPWPDRQGLHGLLVDRPGADPWVLAPPPHGSWVRGGTGEGSPAYVWDLGDIRVPPAPPR